MGNIIALVNEKGGVAKTTTVKNIAAKLAAEGKRVLAVDLDPSANLTASLGYGGGSMEHSIYDIFYKAAESEAEEIPEGFAVLHNIEGIDLVPSSIDMYRMKDIMERAYRKELLLSDYTGRVRDSYDYILLDCPGGLDLLVINALFAADAVMIPTMPHYLDVFAMQNLFRRIAGIRKARRSRKPEIAGVVFTMVRAQTRNDQEVMEGIRKEYAEHLAGEVPIFDTFIPMAVRETETAAAGVSIYKYAPGSEIARAYAELAGEVVRRYGQGRI